MFSVRAASAVVVPSVTRSTVYVCTAEYAWGALPACPHAPRMRRLFRRAASVNRASAGSSEATYENDSFG
jgi:hypothetical protein